MSQLGCISGPGTRIVRGESGNSVRERQAGAKRSQDRVQLGGTVSKYTRVEAENDAVSHRPDVAITNDQQEQGESPLNKSDLRFILNIEPMPNTELNCGDHQRQGINQTVGAGVLEFTSGTPLTVSTDSAEDPSSGSPAASSSAVVDTLVSAGSQAPEMVALVGLGNPLDKSGSTKKSGSRSLHFVNRTSEFERMVIDFLEKNTPSGFEEKSDIRKYVNRLWGTVASTFYNIEANNDNSIAENLAKRLRDNFRGNIATTPTKWLIHIITTNFSGDNRYLPSVEFLKAAEDKAAKGVETKRNQSSTSQIIDLCQYIDNISNQNQFIKMTKLRERTIANHIGILKNKGHNFDGDNFEALKKYVVAFKAKNPGRPLEITVLSSKK